MRAIVVLALALTWAGALNAQTPPPGGHGRHMDDVATLLDLTDDQKTQVQAILKEEHAKIQAAHEQAKASGTQPDWQQMKTLHEQIKQETLQKLTPVLSAAQLKKFQTLQTMHGDMMHGHGFHGGPPSSAPAQN